jgi:hypothetical protein
MPPSEPQREREVQRYLQSWRVAQGSSLNVALNVDSIAAADLHGNGYQPRVSSDKALTAFAQLAVLRLNVKRAMVSLIDADTQTILAEATRNLRLVDPDNAPPPVVHTGGGDGDNNNNNNNDGNGDGDGDGNQGIPVVPKEQSSGGQDNGLWRTYGPRRLLEGVQ